MTCRNISLHCGEQHIKGAQYICLSLDSPLKPFDFSPASLLLTRNPANIQQNVCPLWGFTSWEIVLPPAATACLLILVHLCTDSAWKGERKKKKKKKAGGCLCLRNRPQRTREEDRVLGPGDPVGVGSPLIVPRALSLTAASSSPFSW